MKSTRAKTDKQIHKYTITQTNKQTTNNQTNKQIHNQLRQCITYTSKPLDTQANKYDKNKTTGK